MYTTKGNKMKNILLGIICIIALAIGILNNSYLVAGMYIITLIPVAYMMKNDDTYNLLYGILLVTTFYDYVLYVPGIHNVYLFHIVLGLFTIMTLYKIIRDRNILLKIDKKVLVIFIIWFIYMCVSVTWALNKQLSFKYIAIYIMMFCFIIDIMVYNINKERFEKTINLLIGLISLIIVIGFVEVLLGKQLPVMHHYDGLKLTNLYSFNVLRARPIVFSYNTNNLAATLGILVPICLFGINKFRNIAIKIYLMIISAMGFALVVLTSSRTGLVSIIFGFIIYVIYCICNVKKVGIKVLICPIVLILSFTFLYYNAYKLLKVESMDDTEFLSQNDISYKMGALTDEVTLGGEGSINERFTIISNVVNDVIIDKNILGHGVGNVFQFLKNKDNTMGIYNPHCYPIEILSDFGVPGLILYGIYYLYLLIQNIILGIKKRNVFCFAAVAGLIAFAPASFAPSSITYVFSYWILMAFAISCIQVSKNENDYVSKSRAKEFRFNN